MIEPVTAVEPNRQNDESVPRPTGPGDLRTSSRPEARYTYPSGSRPLDGYTIKRGLGHGGFGEVYYATSDAGKEVALKLIRRNLDIELRGIRHCLNLKHPDLVAIFDIREDSRGDNWVVMEYVGGNCLEETVAAHPNGMSKSETLAWIHGIGAGVAYLHDHGIVHRDLKPGNIFSDEGLVKIGDYGLSKFISCSRRSGQTESVGTVHYMAPEVANGRYGKEIDIYALGVILYEMLSGRVPFEGESVGEVLMKHLTAVPDVSHLAEPYRSVVAKALEKDPAKRFGTVPEMLAGLPQPARPDVRVSTLSAEQQAAAVGATPFRTTVPVAEAIDEEPIYRAVRRGARRMLDTWNESNFNTPTKIVLLVLGVFVFMNLAGVLIPLAILLLIMYACYWLARSIVLALSSGNAPRATPAESPPGGPPVQASAEATASSKRWAAVREGHEQRAQRQVDSRTRRWKRQEKPADVLVLKPARERLAELLGSLLGSAVVAATMCLVIVMLNSLRSNVPFLPQPEQCVWLVLVSIVGAWAVLIPSKFWEGVRGDAMLRRFILMVAGLGVGAFAYGMAILLGVDLPYDVQISPPGRDYQLPPGFYANGAPMLMAHMACFGTLFLVLRWWRQADPLRYTRFGLVSMGFCVLVAWLVAYLWQYPEPWLMMVACAMAAAVQLSSPWMHPRRRRRVADGH